MEKRPLVVLTGPTAVGKTDLSIKLAKRIGGEIISADSMQIYKYMDIGSAKVTREEMDGVRHYLIDELMPTDEFNIAVFKDMAMKAVEEIYSHGAIPIVAGGTGFYIQSLLYNIEFKEADCDLEYRKYLEDYANQNGNEALHKMLYEIDRESFEAIHYNNVKRVIRALEYYKITGQKISSHNETERTKEAYYNSAYFVLNDDRDNLYNRINLRVDKMFDAGLLDEVKKLRDMGYSRDMVSMQGIGYKEVLDYFDGLYTLDEAKEKIKMETRRFAKRQLTWFRREREVIWLDKKAYNYKDLSILDDICKTLKERGIIQ